MSVRHSGSPHRRETTTSATDRSRAIFVSTSCVRHAESMEAQLAEYIQASLTAIELGLTPRSVSPNLTVYLKSLGVEFLVHNYFPAPPEPFVINLASQNADVLRESLSFCKHAITLCAELDARFFSVHVGCRADFAPASLGGQLQYERVHSYEHAYATFLESTRELLSFCAEKGVLLLIEPDHVRVSSLVNGRNELALLVEAHEIVQLMQEVGDSRLGVLLDTGHLNVTARTLGFDRMAYVQRVAPYVRAFHVHDNDGLADTHSPVAPGSWVLDVLRRWECSTQPVIVEARFRTVADLRGHVDWLERELMKGSRQMGTAS